MYVQSDLERHVVVALAALGNDTDPGTVSDAVDLFLCKHERDIRQPVDRDAIGATVAAEAIEAATSWLLALDEPTTPPTSTEARRRDALVTGTAVHT